MTWREYDERSSQHAPGASPPRTRPATASRCNFPTGPACTRRCSACEKAGVVAVGIGSRAGAREVEHLVRPHRRPGRCCIQNRRPSARSPTSRSAADDLWFLNSTSGTTGLPKIVMHDQARWFAFHAFAASHRAVRPPTTCSSARCPPRSASACGPRTSRRRSSARRASCANASTPTTCSPRSSATASPCWPRCRPSS